MKTLRELLETTPSLQDNQAVGSLLGLADVFDRHIQGGSDPMGAMCGVMVGMGYYLCSIGLSIGDLETPGEILTSLLSEAGYRVVRAQ
jgi:hypothetical protein